MRVRNNTATAGDSSEQLVDNAKFAWLEQLVYRLSSWSGTLGGENNP